MNRIRPPRRAAVAIGLSALVMGTVLAGCSDDGDTRTLQVWTPNSSTTDMEAQRKIADLFEEENPGVDVKFVAKPGTGGSDATAIINAVRGGEPPDLFVVDRFTTAQQASIGLLTNLQPFIDADDKDLPNKFQDFARAESTYQGDMYSLPLDTDVRGLIYNKKVLRDAGVDLDQLDPANGPITIDQMMRIAERVNETNENGNYTRMGIIPWTNEASPTTWALIRGAEYYDQSRCELTMDEPAFLQTFQDYQKWAEQLGYQKTSTFEASYELGEQDPARKAMFTDRLGMVITGNYELSNIKSYAPDLDYGVTWLPVVEKGDDPVTWSGGFALSIPTGADNPELSYEFAKFMTGKVGQKIYATDTNRLPTWKALQDDEEIAAAQDFFPEMLPYSMNRPALPVGQRIWDGLTSGMEAVTIGDQTPEEAVEELQRRVAPEMEQFCPYQMDQP